MILFAIIALINIYFCIVDDSSDENSDDESDSEWQ